MDVSSWPEEKIKKALRRKGWSDLDAPLDELRSILIAITEEDTDDDAMKAALEESLSQAQHDFVEIPSTEFVFDISMIRRPLSRAEIAAQMGIREQNLCDIWKDKVAGLSRFENLERNRYTQEIQRAARELPVASDGVIVAVILPHGNRVSRFWDPSTEASSVYVWCAGDEKMAKSAIRLGTFVIAKANGEILDPYVSIGDQIHEQATLFNVWLL